MTEVFGNRIDIRCQLEVQKYFWRDKFPLIVAPVAEYTAAYLQIKW